MACEAGGLKHLPLRHRYTNYVVRISMIKVTVLLINNFVGAKVYCLKVALLSLFCVKWTYKSFLRECKTVNWLVVGYHLIF